MNMLRNATAGLSRSASGWLATTSQSSAPNSALRNCAHSAERMRGSGVVPGDRLRGRPRRLARGAAHLLPRPGAGAVGGHLRLPVDDAELDRGGPPVAIAPQVVPADLGDGPAAGIARPERDDHRHRRVPLRRCVSMRSNGWPWSRRACSAPVRTMSVARPGRRIDRALVATTVIELEELRRVPFAGRVPRPRRLRAGRGRRRRAGGRKRRRRRPWRWPQGAADPARSACRARTSPKAAPSAPAAPAPTATNSAKTRRATRLARKARYSLIMDRSPRPGRRSGRRSARTTSSWLTLGVSGSRGLAVLADAVQVEIAVERVELLVLARPAFAALSVVRLRYRYGRPQGSSMPASPTSSSVSGTAREFGRELGDRRVPMLVMSLTVCATRTRSR